MYLPKHVRLRAISFISLRFGLVAVRFFGITMTDRRGDVWAHRFVDNLTFKNRQESRASRTGQ